MDNEEAMILLYIPFTKVPITRREDVKVSNGNKANGNCKLIKALSRSFRRVSLSIDWNAIKIVGMMAIERVANTRFHRAQ